MKTIWVLAALGVLLPAIPAHAERLCPCKSGPSEVGNKWVGNGQQTTIHRERNVIKERAQPGADIELREHGGGTVHRERNVIKEQGPSGPNLELREHGGGMQGHGMHRHNGGPDVKIKP